MESIISGSIPDGLEPDDPNVARQIKALSRTAPLALKTASDAVKELIFSSMSSNTADTLREDLENLGLKKRGDVETAQLKIVQLVRKLAEEGKIVLMDSNIV